MAVFGDKTADTMFPNWCELELLDFIKTERTWAFAVEVNKSVFLREGGSHQHLSSVAEHIRICRESGNRPSDKLGGLGIGEFLIRSVQSSIRTQSEFLGALRR